MLSFFKVIGNKSVFFELKVLQWMKIYNVFYLNLLSKVFINPLTNQFNKFLPLIIINNKKNWEVNDILDVSIEKFFFLDQGDVGGSDLPIL